MKFFFISVVFTTFIFHLLLLDDAVHSDIVDGEVLQFSGVSHFVKYKFKPVVGAIWDHMLLRIRPGRRGEQGVHGNPELLLSIFTYFIAFSIIVGIKRDR